MQQAVFSRYQKFIIAALAILQFTVVLDFMVLSPLGAQLMRIMHISPSQFALVVSSYAISAGLAGFLSAGFADKFDRKKLLLFFYTGFIIGTFCCGIASSYIFLLIARIVTGIFGGVIAAVSFAIITDLFAVEVRGRVMGFVQMSFAASQVLGIPLGLYLAGLFDWHSPFLLITGIAIAALFLIMKYMRPVTHHLQIQTGRNALGHLIHTLSKRIYRRGFLTTTLLATGGFMLMPFASAFLVNNVGITELDLPVVFMITGLCAIITGPLIGKLSDKVGKYPLFVAGSILAMIMVVIYTNMKDYPLWLVITINAILFMGITSRMISYSALITAVPEPADRGAFMGVNSSLQQLSGGIASIISGFIVIQATPTSTIYHYDTVGYIVVISMIVCLLLMRGIDIYVRKKHQRIPDAASIPVPVPAGH
jgi:predicted MFS family arabinose efflux permease